MPDDPRTRGRRRPVRIRLVFNIEFDHTEYGVEEEHYA